jgi:hypothetical protein
MFDMPPVDPISLPPVAELRAEVAHRASKAAVCATAQNGRSPRMIVVADMGRPSSEARMWAFDISNPREPRLVARDWVAHGAGSDLGKTGQPDRFGYTPESGMTSLGLFEVAEPYIGQHGRSFRLDGLTPGWSHTARVRNVVLHPAAYVRPGRVGRSLGCPAVRHEVLTELESEGLGTGTLLWIDGPGAAAAEAATCPGGSSTLPADHWPASQPATGICRPAAGEDA